MITYIAQFTSTSLVATTKVVVDADTTTNAEATTKIDEDDGALAEKLGWEASEASTKASNSRSKSSWTCGGSQQVI